MSRGACPIKIISKYSANAYKVDLDGEYGVPTTFHVGDILITTIMRNYGDNRLFLRRL